MSKRHALLHDVVLEYKFDRLHECKIAQVYEKLVPYKRGKIERHTETRNDKGHEERSDLRKGFFRAAAGSADDW